MVIALRNDSILKNLNGVMVCHNPELHFQRGANKAPRKHEYISVKYGDKITRKRQREGECEKKDAEDIKPLRFDGD